MTSIQIDSMVLNITKKTVMEGEQALEVRKERRNGMGNIFDGIEPEILQRLGWTEKELDKVEEVARRNITEEGSDHGHSHASDSSETESDPGMDLDLIESLHEMSRLPVLPCSIEADVSRCLSNRKRRNGLADLFEALSVNQKQVFVKLIKAGPARHTCVSH